MPTTHTQAFLIVFLKETQNWLRRKNTSFSKYITVHSRTWVGDKVRNFVTDAHTVQSNIILNSGTCFSHLACFFNLLFKFLKLFCPVRSVVLASTAWNCSRGSLQDCSGEAVSKPVDVLIFRLYTFGVGIGESWKLLPFGPFVVPSGKGLGILWSVLQIKVSNLYYQSFSSPIECFVVVVILVW